MYPLSPPQHHTACTYQLLIRVPSPMVLDVGRLGRFPFPAGHYVYTGSARRNLAARVARHLRREKALRWHIDYLLVSPGVEIVDVRLSQIPECRWNQSMPGQQPAPGFGASDCRQGCGSHLKWLGWATWPDESGKIAHCPTGPTGPTGTT